ncbi:MAG: metal-sulfur cluster biosynthetic enzyme [Deltaproteobacteria bacterium]|nr:DUF59 domain-containing protein [Deltaproteobacteria bacterium]RLA98284.1 MAG: metal-sulfur cluster biosynthetic enzyme [Deltaproteobacteria bacterium]
MLKEDEVKKIISEVMHPAINLSLVELGMVKDIVVEKGRVSMKLMIPFPNIPILDYLISSLKRPLEQIGADVDIEVKQMSEEEVQYFLNKERENWKGM